MEIIGFCLALLVGITLGLIGGGGSILTVPILVYLFQIKPELATSYSLFIVGIASLLGSYKHHKLGNLQITTAINFGVPSILVLLFTRNILLPAIPTNLFSIGNLMITKSVLLMIVFALLMITASASMITTKKNYTQAKEINKKQLILIGLLVGFVTGLLGAGGGFLIIPALIFFAGLSMKQAVGTSLFIIAINSLIGFMGDILNGVIINFQLLFTFSTIAVLGIFIGTYISKKVDGNKLKPIFGWFVLAMGFYIILKEIFIK